MPRHGKYRAELRERAVRVVLKHQHGEGDVLPVGVDGLGRLFL